MVAPATFPRERGHVPMPVPAEQVAAVLDTAAQITRAGWSQFHVATDVEGRPLESAADPRAVAVCALGAIARAADGQKVALEVRVAAIRVFGDYVVVNGASVAKWNEVHGQSGEYVAQKLHAAGREHVRGGPAHVAAVPPPVVGGVPPEVAPRPRAREFTPESALRADRGRLVGTLQSQRRNGADEASIAATEGRIRAVDKRLRDDHGVDMPPPPAGLSPPDPDAAP